MCFVVHDLFKSDSAYAKWLLCLFAGIGIFSCCYWVLIIPFLYYSIKVTRSPDESLQYFNEYFFIPAFLIWLLILAIIIALWYRCRRRSMKQEDALKTLLDSNNEDTVRISQMNEKARITLGLDEDLEKFHNEVRKSRWQKIKEHKRRYIDAAKLSNTLQMAHANPNLIPRFRTKKKNVDDLVLDDSRITPLPEYSPEAENEIFHFPEKDESNEQEEQEIDDDEQENKISFQDYLHIVQIEPESSVATLEEDLREAINCMLEKSKETEEQSEQQDPELKPGEEQENVEPLSKNDEDPNIDVYQQEVSPIHDKDYSQMLPGNEEGDGSDVLSAQDEQHPLEEQKISKDTEDSELETLVINQDSSSQQDLNTEQTEFETSLERQENSDAECPPGEDQYIGATVDETQQEVIISDSNNSSSIEVEALLKEESPENEEDTNLCTENQLEESGSPDSVEEHSPINLQKKEDFETTKSSDEPPRKFEKKGSAMFLGVIGKSQSVLSEMYVEVGQDGTLKNETALLMGRHEVIKTHEELNK